MSAFPAEKVGVSCPEAGCEWTFTGEPDQALYELRAHGLEHEDAAPKAPKLEEPAERERAVGSPVPATGKSITDIANEERVILLGKPITVRCFDCPDLEWTGTSYEARLQWAEHRRDEHDDSSAMASIERMDRKLTTRDLQRMQTGAKTVDENVAKTKRSGGGHAVVEDSGATRSDPEAPGPNGAKASGDWTRETVIEAIKAYAAEHGYPPASKDWVTIAEGRPTTFNVKRLFGSWADAIEAAGFARPSRGGNRKGSRTVQTTPPPRPKPAKGRDEGHKPPPIAPEPAPQAASQGAPERTLVELAQVVDQLSTRRKAMLAELDTLETELRAAIDGCAAALDAERLEAA